ncbi:MAG: hypothetical protein Q9220_003547 [cf. Caloplaca sp. 1 TL-2023]
MQDEREVRDREETIRRHAGPASTAVTRTTFRIPSQPLLQADGARWQWLYHRLRTQTRLYTWGSNGCGNCGHGFNLSGEQADIGWADINTRNIGWPKRVPLEEALEKIGIVADVQCGGWSTTLLNSVGNLYLCGGVNPSSAFMTRSVNRRGPRRKSAPQARKLTFPPAYPATTKDRHEPSTAINQYSTGRSHILGLADDGKVWQWNLEEALLIKPLHVVLSNKRVKRVAAGWDRASMYVAGTGIVYWPDDIGLRAQSVQSDAVLIDTATIPGTGAHPSQKTRQDQDTLESRIGCVTNHIVLENYILFSTDLNKLFLYRADFPLPALDPPEPIELIAFYPSAPDPSFKIHDIQGSFRSFAVFTSSGGVLLGYKAMLEAFHAGTTSHDPTASTDPSSHPHHPAVIPALQNNSIISVAFGDYHFQALRSDGTIYAYGKDPQASGALGLGFPEGTGPLRGLKVDRGPDAFLGPDTGRQVWFDPLMHQWLGEMKEKAGVEEGEAAARGEMVLARQGQVTQDHEAATAVGDYFEREGEKWEDGVVKNKEEGGGMGSYFVLKVAAAGWHSAALVLVDEEQAERSRRMHIVPPEAEKQEEVVDEETDWHGGTWEDIDAPWDQLSKAVSGALGWLWEMGRWFLGLTLRDQQQGDASQRRDPEELGSGADKTRYTWTDQPFPRLRMANGDVMPGEVEVTE